MFTTNPTPSHSRGLLAAAHSLRALLLLPLLLCPVQSARAAVVMGPDAAVTVTADLFQICIDEPVTLFIEARNTGTDPLTGVTVTAELPSNLTFLSDTAGGSFAAPTWTWGVGDLAVGEVATAELSTQLTDQEIDMLVQVGITADQALATPGDETAAVVLNDSTPGYGLVDSLIFGGPAFQFVDIGATGTFVVAGDDQVAPADLSAAPFLFYENTHSAILAATNGFLTTDLADNGSDITPDCPLPAAPSSPIGTDGARMYPLHDESVVNDGVYHQHFANAPRPHDTDGAIGVHVIQFNDVTHFGAVTPEVDYQVLLYDNGDIYYQYNDDWPVITTPPTIGVQNEADTGPSLATTWNCGTPGVVQQGIAVRFYRTGGTVDLSLEMTALSDPVDPGAEVEYLITVTNHGPNPATGVTVTDVLPSAELSFVSASCPSSVFDPGTGTWTWDVGDLADGESTSCTLTALVERCAVIDNTATVTLDQTEICDRNNSATVRINSDYNRVEDGGFEAGLPSAAWTGTTVTNPGVPPIDDGTDSGGPARTGDWFAAFTEPSTLSQTVTIPVSHEGVLTFHLFIDAGLMPFGGPIDSFEVTLGGDTVFTVSGADPLYTAGYRQVVIDVTDHANGLPEVLEFESINAGISFFLDDVSLAGCPLVDLSLTKVGGAPEAVPGDTFTYEITVLNQSPNTGVGRVVDVFDPRLTDVSWTCTVSAGSTCENESGMGDIDETVELLGGGSAVFDITATVAPDARGTIVNTASVEVIRGGQDPEPGDDEDTVETTLTPSASVSMDKEGPSSPVAAGSQFDYTLTVTNGGPSTATNVLVVDTLPAQLTFVSAETTVGMVNEAAGVVTAQIASLSPGASAVITIRVQVALGFVGVVENTAVVERDEFDPEPGDDEDTVETVIAGGDIDVPIAVAFGTSDVCIGPTLPEPLTITNVGNDDLAIISVSIASGEISAFMIVSDTGETVLAPTESRTLEIVYNATAVGMQTAFLQIISSDPDESEVLVNLLGDGSVPSYVGTQDLSAWTFYGPGGMPTSLGPTFPGQSGYQGVAVPDNDGDGSVNDLVIDIPDDEGMSYLSWYSPAGLISFSDECVFKVDFTVTGDPASFETGPQLRFRWFYGNAAELGSGKVVADPVVAPASPDGRRYTMMFDQLPVGDRNNPLPLGNGSIPANSITLAWETIDFHPDAGGGRVELDDVQITRIERAAVVAAGTLERQVQDFTDPTQFAEATEFNLILEEGISVTTSPASATINATFPNTFNDAPETFRLFGNETPMAFGGGGLTTFTPSAGPGRFFRAEYQVTGAPNTEAQPLPMVVMTLATYNSIRSQQYTSEAHITTELPDLIPVPGFRLNGLPVLPATHTTYLHLPEGIPLGANDSVGDQIGASIRLVDSADNTGGALNITDIAVYSHDESILP